jgi:hypothetical protein
MASTKMGFGDWTYAQKSCCAAAMKGGAVPSRYQSNSACKLLIYIEDFKLLFFRAI